ncbi:MAG: AI-2E family transporter [Desulfomicrobium sp.]|nr:AI-2E family transporter [Pseudomonadota bacterium]MBV1713259.1 AI-2E family transporter [Desulfomicrobium sp.]MBU4571362.1 AI-2E family transporter [Pseudomonadota bacterium]MBU4595625.1 AI-2E family transporter [Pseudomonadota bacterium]MBV1720066.1 AI-2E family transporter [Desulfomicrobium sp.]
MPNNSTTQTKRHSVSYHIILGAALFAFINTFTLLSHILLSFLLVLLISFALNPVILWMRTFTGGRALPTGLVVGGFISILVLTGWAFLGPMQDSITNISKQLPGYWERLQKPLIMMEQRAAISEKKLQAEVSTEIARTDLLAGEPGVQPAPVTRPKANAPEDSGSIRSSLSEMFGGVVSSFTSVAFSGTQFLIVMVTVFFGVSFTLLNPRPIVGALFAVVPLRHHDKALVVVQRIGMFAPRWAGAMLVGMVAIGLLVFLAMWPIFGFTDALVLGLIAGMLEAIPFLGPILSSVPALLLAFSMGGMTPLWVAIIYVAVQIFENNILVPYVMADSMNLHPTAVIFSMLLCVGAFGVLGVLVAAPLVAIAVILHEELYQKQFLHTVTDEYIHEKTRQALHEK